jgi:hypothetical protein
MDQIKLRSRANFNSYQKPRSRRSEGEGIRGLWLAKNNMFIYFFRKIVPFLMFLRQIFGVCLPPGKISLT